MTYHVLGGPPAYDDLGRAVVTCSCGATFTADRLAAARGKFTRHRKAEATRPPTAAVQYGQPGLDEL